MEEKKEVVVEKKKEVSIGSNNKVTDYSLGIFGTSDNFIMAMQMAKALASSTIVPQTFQKNDSNCLIAISQAQKFDIDPLTVMQNLYVIQGRPSWKSSFLIAMINNSGKYDMELQFEEKEKNGKPYSCQCWTTKDERRVDGINVTMDMADAEGWTKKNGTKWRTLPQLMLRYRAASFFANLNCPELTTGMYTREEMLDNDFSDSFGKDIQSKVKEEIKENENSHEFVVEDESVVAESDAIEVETPEFAKE